MELDPTKQQLKRTATNTTNLPTAAAAHNIHQSNAEIQQQLLRQQQQLLLQQQAHAGPAPPGQAAQNSVPRGGGVQPQQPTRMPVGGSEAQQSQSRGNTHGVLGGSVTTPAGQAGGQRLNIGIHGSLGIQPTQTQGGGGVVPMSPGGVGISGGGGGLLTTATPTSILSNSLGNAVGLSTAVGSGGGGGHMISHDPDDDSVFSPGIVDDERMKLLERVGFMCHIIFILYIHVYLVFNYVSTLVGSFFLIYMFISGY